METNTGDTQCDPPTSDDLWCRTLATVTTCSPDWLSFSSESDCPQQYRVRFTYVVQEKVFTGHYLAGTWHAPGETFGIFYNSQDPSKNTGEDRRLPLWARMVAIAVGVAILWWFIRNGWFS